jgi:PKD repeat protein
MRRFAGGPAPLLVLLVFSGCTAASAPSTTTTTTSPPPTTIALPPTTTTTTTAPVTPTTHVVTDYGDGLFVEQVPFVPSGATTALPGVFRPRVTYAMRNVTWVNEALHAFVDDRVEAFGPGGPPPGYSLGFAVLWTGAERVSLLSLVFAEVRPASDGGEPVVARPVLLFDLVEWEELDAAGMLTATGVSQLAGLVTTRLVAEQGEGFCCVTPEDLVGDIGVLPEGLMAYLDETDGIPPATGPMEFLFPWSEIAPLIDMHQPHLAAFAQAQGLCSASNQEWVLDEQPGLPAAVAARRAAIFAAAAACDYAELEALAGDGDGFTGPLANGVHPGTAEAYRDREGWGYADLWWLLTTLNLPYAEKTYTYGDGTSWTGYVWPAAEGVDWDHIPPAQAAVLRELYAYQRDGYLGEEWDQGRFFGFHVAITPEGAWVWVGFSPA